MQELVKELMQRVEFEEQKRQAEWGRIQFMQIAEKSDQTKLIREMILKK